MLLKSNLFLAGGIALALACGFQSANAQGVFIITSKSFKDGDISPELSWANPPAGTKSF